jgi:hypothetical protein
MLRRRLVARGFSHKEETTSEACMTAVYVQNISPHKSLRNMNPEKAFTRVKA